MELFKFNYDTDPTVLERGENINEIKRILWVERYREPGEFEIAAPLSTGLKDFLPIGTLISHADTLEVMIVENHEINDVEQQSPLLTITGRSFVSYLENRIIGVNVARQSPSVVDYNIAADYSWNQIVTLINDFIATPYDADDALVNVIAQSSVVGTGVSEIRAISRIDVLDAVLQLLAVDDLGIRTVRRNTFGIGSSTQTLISIYKGVDRSSEVILSWEGGDLSSVEYLFSGKKNKTSALVFGQFVYTVVDMVGPVNYDRRIMLVDATDLDGHLNAEPVGTTLDDMLAQMAIRGRTALLSQNDITITQTDISKTTQYQYRRDYDVGDLISIDGNYGQIAVMRVIEYAEVEDENGESGHPTLALPGE